MDMQVKVVTATSSSVVDTPDGKGLMVWSEDGVYLITGVQTPTRGLSVEALKCPECKEPFDSPIKLGVHRRKMHGVAGKNAKRK